MIVILTLLACVALVLLVAAGFEALRAARTHAEPRKELVALCHGDAAVANRLVAYEIGRTPGISEREATRRAVQRLARDRGSIRG